MADFRTGYMDKALDNLADVIAEAQTALADVEFDTLVGTGFSGGVVIPALALAMDKKWTLIRKESDDSHHGGGRLIGSLGKRWVFVDDFVSSGATRTRVLEKIEAGAVLHDLTSEYVGDYLYGIWEPDERFRSKAYYAAWED